jgi:serine/threonine protein kinase
MNRGPVAVVRLNHDVPTKLEDIINKALEKDRNLRYQHASDMRSDLQRLKRDTDSGKSAAMTESAPVSRGRRLQWIAAGAVGVIAAIVIAHSSGSLGIPPSRQLILQIRGRSRCCRSRMRALTRMQIFYDSPCQMKLRLL